MPSAETNTWLLDASLEEAPFWYPLPATQTTHDTAMAGVVHTNGGDVLLVVTGGRRTPRRS